MSSIVFSPVDDFNLKFKKQSENLKTLRRRENTASYGDTTDRTVDE